MTRYFKCIVYIFDEEEFNTEKEVKEGIEEMMDMLTIGHDGLVWEEVQAMEVELEEYEKEDQNGKI